MDYGITGLGPAQLYQLVETFGLGKPTGIDLPGEAPGFLPTPAWWSTVSTRPWSLGDTYNVSIGQGSLAVTPIQLLSYIDAIANGGKIYKPFLNASSTPVRERGSDIAFAADPAGATGDARGGDDPRGTAYTMDDLPAQACAKTGSAQVQNNQEENALFVGYFPCINPQIALLILIENSKQGSLNAVPIAKNIFDWYYYKGCVVRHMRLPQHAYHINIKTMSELRQDLTSGDWVLIAPGRAARPKFLDQKKKARKPTPKSTCPFEDLKSTGNWPPILALPDEKHWRIAVIPNKYPAISTRVGVLCAVPAGHLPRAHRGRDAQSTRHA